MPTNLTHMCMKKTINKPFLRITVIAMLTWSDGLKIHKIEQLITFAV
jgi:hypothetical protein